MSAKQGTLLCLPDISGFTEFMTDVDHDLASKVIPALLNEIIYANTIGLKVSEIEGDAVFFYKKEPLPSFDALVDQCLHFYQDFYAQLNVLKKEYQNHEKAQAIPEILGLKIILHYGQNIGMTQIGNRIKLLGEDVIVAHKLLKNSIEENEYLLFTDSLLGKYSEEEIRGHVVWKNLEKDEERFEHLNEIGYRYLPSPSHSMI